MDVGDDVGSAAIPLLLGIGLGDMVAGLPIGSDAEFTGDFGDIFTAYGLWTGLTLLSLSVLHGATFLGLRTTGGARRSRAIGVRCAVATLWRPPCSAWNPSVLSIVAVVAVLAAAMLRARARGLGVHRHRGGDGRDARVAVREPVPERADLQHQRVVQPDGLRRGLGPYALKVMTIAAAIFVPLVLLYQSWNYRCFARVGGPVSLARGLSAVRGAVMSFR